MLPKVAVIYLMCSLLCLMCGAQKCDSQIHEGDKWFDGCNWCTCISNEQKCTKATCPVSNSDDYQAPVCEKVGESWRDGCFHCHCLTTGIHCKNDKRCVMSLHDYPTDCKSLTDSLGDDLCICGVDGVPSCASEALSRFTPSASSTEKDPNGIMISLDDGSPNIELREEGEDDAFSDGRIPLIPTEKKNCILGRRWYGGELRCYCDNESGVTCGNPRYVARKIDGFKIRRKKCTSGNEVKERCSVCLCKMDGLLFCEIDRQCIKNTNIRHSMVSKPTRENECKIGSRWRDGCKRCRCNKHGKAVCKSRHCNQSMDDKTDGSAIENRRSSAGAILGRSKSSFKMPDKPRFRMPSLYPGMFFQRKKRPSTKKPNCSGFQPGEKYWDKCNLCRCTEGGDPLCSSKIC